MSWAALKTDLRKAVHAAFSHTVQYTAPTLGAAPVVMTVRLHQNVELFGDLDREGYARTAEAITRIVFTNDQSPLPVRGGLVVFEDGSSYKIKSVWPMEGPLEIPCEVVPA